MNTPGFIDHCLELLAPNGAPRTRRMFGGHGLWLGDLFVGIVIDDTLYLKAGDATRAAFEAAGGRPFTPPGRDGLVHSLGFWTVPEEAMESPRELAPWVRRAVAAAVAARAPRRRSAVR